jgi:hypothetical protein
VVFTLVREDLNDAIAFVVHLGNNAPVEALIPSFNRSSGRSSGVEHDLAKVGVEGSNPFARSSFPFAICWMLRFS